jgi:hypothetical protein
MPHWPASLSIPGPVLVIGILALVVLISAGTLVSALRGRSGGQNSWGKAFGGARRQQRQQAAQMDELHRAVTNLSAKKPKSDESNE